VSAEGVPASAGTSLAAALVGAIRANAAELSVLDGAIGDGDHGVNMAKGFGIAADRIGTRQVSVSEALQTIADTLLADVGGAMGPLYGTLLGVMAAASSGADWIDAAVIERMLDHGVDAVLELGGAHVGDKTLVDVLVPARDAFRDTIANGASLGDALDAMADAADRGKESTRDLVARVGRASRLGERSRGNLDAGAVSCSLLIAAFAATLGSQISVGD
jgi:dihydroxyacetone kinase-like protein